MFENKIRPVLVEHCYSCHSAKKTRGGLALDTRDGLRKGGVSGPSIVAGKANESLLIVSLRHTDPDLKMPQKGPKLSDDVIADFIRWVNAGAFDPRDLTTTAKRDGDWWSLRPLRRPEIPKIDGPDAGWVKTSIDAFILASLREKKLTHSKAAEPRVLIRRMSLDLLGLPPTPEDVERFCEDYAAVAKKQEAVERLADRLLASPHYGERWARHWLDVVHFGESNGFGMDRPRMNAWPYRDYVINAFNSDKPYARFVQEQIAADILFPNEGASIPALGFAAAGPFNQSALVEQVDGTDCRKIALNLDRDDIATNVATTFLSMTVHCARCHEHKFDPIDQRDYYRFQAVFAGVGRAERPVNSSTQRAEWQNRKNMLDKGGDPFSAEERKGLAVAQAAWEEGVRPDKVDWQALSKLEAKSEAGTEFTQMADGSYLCGGKRPDKDTYTFTAKLPAKGLAAVKLEVLTDSSLPQQGPGRQDNGNLTLSEFRVRIAPASEPNKGIEVPLVNPQADFSQDGWEIARAIDSRKETGWAIYPEVGKSHFATFEFKSPIAQDGDSLVTFQLEQLHGTGHLIGRLRLSVANRAPPLGKTPLPATIAADLRIPPQQRTPEQADRIYKHFVRLHIDGQIAALPQSPKVWAIAADFPPIRNYKAPKEPVPIHVLKRGDFKQPLDPVGPGGLDCVKTLKAEFADINPKAEGERRAALARWITDPENMLTWRSIANRVWHYHFGKGIVDSPNDLGRMGSPPTHPELLDWLAVELRDNGGSLKKLHRLIVTSAVYNQ
ncbi:MAG: PSD1 and planctomycete cytochrome C domain-containing protein, partial [Planctomycetota bacterium]